jgi:hypothetical protein
MIPGDGVLETMAVVTVIPVDLVVEVAISSRLEERVVPSPPLVDVEIGEELVGDSTDKDAVGAAKELPMQEQAEEIRYEDPLQWET